MTEEQFSIDISRLEEAQSTSDRQWLDKTFTRARQVIEAGGRVSLTQRYSDSSLELVSIIDNLEGLNHYIKKYSR